LSTQLGKEPVVKVTNCYSNHLISFQIFIVVKSPFCFKCGNELTKETVTKEHIPAKVFYSSLPAEYKVNLMTIPACRKCNEDHSKFDAVMRDAIGIMNEHNILHNELTKKAVSSILTASKLERLTFGDDGRVIAVEFDLDDFNDLALKTHYGIFYDRYEMPIPQYCATSVEWHGVTYEQVAVYEEEVIGKYGWNSIGHEDVFRYQMQDMHVTEDGKLYSTGSLTGAIMVVSVMEFYRSFKFYGLSVRKNFLKQENKKRNGGSSDQYSLI